LSGVGFVCINRFLIKSDAWFESATIAGLLELFHKNKYVNTSQFGLSITSLEPLGRSLARCFPSLLLRRGLLQVFLPKVVALIG